MENKFFELKNTEVNHIRFGKGIITSINIDNSQEKIKVFFKVEFNNDLKKVREFEITKSILNYGFSFKDIDIREYINYLELHKENKKVKNRIKILQERNIEYLVHFTQIDNLCNILKFGLLSINKLNKNNIKYFCSDEIRIDNKLDYICTSISFPNYKMFWKKRNENINKKWVVIKINAKVIIKNYNTLFLQSNSAKNIIKNKIFKNENYYITDQALNDLFAEQVGKNIRSKFIESNMTTDPQAEVLVKDYIGKEYIMSIVVEDYEVAKLVKAISNGINVDIEINKEFFSPRKDYEEWSEKNDETSYFYN